jgi:tetratricopeptide (TPR) repeat protein
VGGQYAPWELLTGYRISMALAARDWTGAERLTRVSLTHHRAQAATALATPADRLTDDDRYHIHSLAVIEENLGHVLREQDSPDCVAAYTRAVDLFRRIDARREEAVVAYNLGRTHTGVPELRDLNQAERWYLRSLDLTDDSDRLGRAQTVGQLGYVAGQRFLDAQRAGEPDVVLLRHLEAAIGHYRQMLAELPDDAITDLAVGHNQLGVMYAQGGAIDAALHHWQQSIRYKEQAGDRYGAGQSRFNVAVVLDQAGRTDDALLYAHAALRDFASYGSGAATEVEDTQQLIAELERPPTGSTTS